MLSHEKFFARTIIAHQSFFAAVWRLKIRIRCTFGILVEVWLGWIQREGGGKRILFDEPNKIQKNQRPKQAWLHYYWDLAQGCNTIEVPIQTQTNCGLQHRTTLPFYPQTVYQSHYYLRASIYLHLVKGISVSSGWSPSISLLCRNRIWWDSTRVSKLTSTTKPLRNSLPFTCQYHVSGKEYSTSASSLTNLV
jgi:hypothetical protein